MKSTHALQLITLASLGSLMSAAARADDESYYYGGLSVGQTLVSIDGQHITDTLKGQGLSTTSIDRRERDTGYKLFGGHQMNRYFGIELGYFNLGNVGFTAHTAPSGTLDGQLRIQGLNLDLVGTLPFTEKFSGLVRLGPQYARTRDSFSSSGAVTVSNPNPSDTQWNPKVGIGLQYAVTRDFLVRAGVEHFRISDAMGQRANVNLSSVSLVFPLNRAPMSAPRPVAMAPAYVAPAPVVVAAPVPPPAPVVVAVVTPPRTPAVLRRVSFSAEALFVFDHAEVLPDGRVALDTFAKELRSMNFDSITVEGHTDRLGSVGYNQTLSTQRAEAVKSYLVSVGVDGAKIAAVGKSESTPVTKADECKGHEPSARLIACLQPDRRVEIEVVGTR